METGSKNRSGKEVKNELTLSLREEGEPYYRSYFIK